MEVTNLLRFMIVCWVLSAFITGVMEGIEILKAEP